MNIDDGAVLQGIAFVMLLSGRIDAKLYEAAKTAELSKKRLLSLAAFLKMTETTVA